MKKKTTALCVMTVLLVVTIKVNGQTSTGSKVEITKPVCVTAYEPVAVLELGKANIVRVAIRDTSVRRLLVNASQGTVSQQGENYIIKPARPGELVLGVYNYNDIDNPVFVEELRMEVAGAPFATLAGKQGGTISSVELSNAKKIEVSGLDGAMKVREFKISVAADGIPFKEFYGSDEFLTEEMVNHLINVPDGGKIYIEYIAAGNVACGSRALAPLSFTVSRQ
jgi:hypothetical protein